MKSVKEFNFHKLAFSQISVRIFSIKFIARDIYVLQCSSPHFGFLTGLEKISWKRLKTKKNVIKRLFSRKRYSTFTSPNFKQIEALQRQLRLCSKILQLIFSKKPRYKTQVCIAFKPQPLAFKLHIDSTTKFHILYFFVNFSQPRQRRRKDVVKMS